MYDYTEHDFLLDRLKHAYIFNEKDLTEIAQIRGHKLNDLLLLAEIYKQKGIILENVAEAFKEGYEFGREETYEIFNNQLKRMAKDIRKS